MYKAKMMIVMRRDLKMRKGKIAAQAGHACVDAVLMALKNEARLDELEMTAEGMMLRQTDKPRTPLSDWFGYGCAKICVYVDSEQALLEIAQKARERGILASVITDAGLLKHRINHFLPSLFFICNRIPFWKRLFFPSGNSLTIYFCPVV